MLEFDLEIALQHLKADPGCEDELIARYFGQAVSVCEDYCNRVFYKNAAEQIADYSAAMAELMAARTVRDTGLELAGDDAEIRGIVTNIYIVTRAKLLRRLYGVVVNDTIMAAVYMMLGHFYKNRQEVVVSQYSGATQLPAGAKRILEPWLWIGDLGGAA